MTETERQQFKNDVLLLLDIAFDGACVSFDDECLMERIRENLEKI